jgi:AraC-like DNA-binding protein/quercetin dioxygenase-like cupin family protein
VDSKQEIASKGANTDIDRVVHWLVSALELESSVFHVGQHCGAWRASTAGRARASFHLVLRGECYLQVTDQAPIKLGARDAVFLLRDIPHSITSEASAGQACVARPMLPMEPPLKGGTGLACGFFEFKGKIGELLVNSFPDYLILRSGTPALAAVAPLFDLILAEAGRNETACSPLIERLTELLFYYVIRDASQRRDVAAGLWAVVRRPQFAPLINHLLRAPGEAWALEDMARLAHMSRASFCKHFSETCGQPPAQFLLSLRMNIAAQRLREGESVTRAAEHVGYLSPAAFTRAFKKVIGEQPGAYQRARKPAAMRAAAGDMH